MKLINIFNLLFGADALELAIAKDRTTRTTIFSAFNKGGLI